MSGAFIPTGTYSNLTRLELEALRRADFTAGEKALTIGDSDLAPEKVVGRGSPGAERFSTGPSVNLDDVYPITPPGQPGPGLGTTTTPSALNSEYARWYGPVVQYDSTATGYNTTTTQWRDDDLSIDYVTLGIQPGDVLLIKDSNAPLDQNANVVGTISVVFPAVLTLTNIYNPLLGTAVLDTTSTGADKFSYLIVRPTATQLFAVPGSGPTGQEQSFLMVLPGPLLHSQMAPTTAAINSARVQDIVRPSASTNPAVDRADWAFDFPSFTRLTGKQSLLTLGYRVVLYPDNGLGTGPDLTKPITTLNPIIDPAIPVDDQRMTIDYKAGVVRFSCAPATGSVIKPTVGCVNVTTGRLNLYAVFWAIDLSLTRGNARGLYSPRSTIQQSLTAGKVRFDETDLGGSFGQVRGWRVGSTPSNTDAYLKSVGAVEGKTSPNPNVWPFAQPWLRNSAELGAIEQNSGGGQNGLRYISWRQGGTGWRFLNRRSDFDGTDGYAQSEMSIADKTEFTIADASSPAQGYAADLNPASTFDGGTGRGIRSHESAGLQDSRFVTSLLASSYGTAHLKRGTYYIQNAIHVPPGMTIEGEGPGTKLIYRNFDTTAPVAISRVAALFKVGPNTTWGVWDASATPSTTAAYGTDIQPTTMTLASANTVIEGQDMLWNPVRRCWAIAYADATSQSIFFNEILADGTQRWPGLGLNVKDNATTLWVASELMGENHSGGHYPRLAYHEHSNTYAITWVEKFSPGGGLFGGRVAVRFFEVTQTDSSVGWTLSLDPSFYTTPTSQFADHPSIAIENWNTGDTAFVTALSFWTYDINIGQNITNSNVDRRYYQNGVLTAQTNSVMATHSVVSSTDVKADELGGFLTVWSVRAHRLVTGTTGNIVFAGVSYLINAGGAFDFSVPGVVVGSKFHYLTSANPLNPGHIGIVHDMSNPFQPRIKWEGGSTFVNDAVAFNWALTPPSSILGQRTAFSGGLPTEVGLPLLNIVQANVTTPGFYQMEMREPDYVRLSRGAAGWCVAFQGMNTDSWTSLPSVRNYDDSLTPFTHTVSGIPMGDTAPYREHISTCAVILRDDGRVVSPNEELTTSGFPTATGGMTFSAADSFPERVARDIEVTHKSLGTRDPIMVRSNFQSLATGFPTSDRIPSNFSREVSYQNYSYRWSGDTLAPDQGVQAVIPGITWTGQDWVIVSPAKNKIHSKMGAYQIDGIDSYLSDATFYFGEDLAAQDTNGSYLRRSLPTGRQIYFPATGTTHGFVVVDEHTIKFPNVHPLGGVPLNNQEWCLICPADPLNAGIKNQGFRINPEGEVLNSTSFLTWADQPADDVSALNRRETSLMRRVQPRGGNYPASVAGPGTFFGLLESTDALQAESRYKANINFRGVAPGRPKGCNNFNLRSSPSLALAWGENSYGLLDHLNEGLGGLNTLQFFRQSFGPYNVTLRNFQVEAASTQPLQKLSQTHVYTRHYAPCASTLSFDTDGFRNVYVYPASRVVSWYSNLGNPPVNSYIQAVYTDAKGMNPLLVEGPQLVKGDFSQWSSDISEDTPLASPGDFQRTMAQGIGPKVLWDGQRFCVFWVERSTIAGLAGLSAGTQYGYVLGMSYLPGSDDDGLQGPELTSPFEAGLGIRRQPLASAFISDGSGGTDQVGDQFADNSVAICEVAFSGKTYAVVWVAGCAPWYDVTGVGGRVAGSTFGVTIFNLNSAVPADVSVSGGIGNPHVGGGSTFVIEQSTEPGAFHNPKIIWDGTRYVVFYESTTLTNNATPPTLSTLIAFAFIGEDGLGQPTAIKKMQSAGLVMGTAYPSGAVGSAGPFTVTPDTQLGYALATGTFLNPGAPEFGSPYTVIQTFGSSLSPALRSAADGAMAPASFVFNSPSSNFFAEGVRPGDILDITGAINTGVRVIEEVLTATSLRVQSTYLPGGFLGALGQAFNINRHTNPNIQPGDVLVVSHVVRSGGPQVESSGVYPIINYNPQNHQLMVAGLFDPLDCHLDGVLGTIRGEIRSGGISDYDNAPAVGAARAGTSPRSYPIQNPAWGSSLPSSVTRLHGVAYNQVDDEFACFVSQANNVSSVFTFRPDTRSGDPLHALNDPGFTAILGTGEIAWNGSRYLTAAPWADLATGDVAIRVDLLNAKLGTEDTLVLHPSVLLYTNPASLYGNGPNQIPGPGYGPFPNYTGIGKTGGVMWPLAQQVKVRWNDRMSRWVVAASVLWYDQRPTTPANNGVGEYQHDGVFYAAGLAQTLIAWAGQTMTMGAASSLWQPGMKIAITTGVAPTPTTITAVLTIQSVVGGGPLYSTFTVDADVATIVGAGPQGVNIGFSQVKPIVREDVMTWTVGQSERGLIIEDADGVHVENVTIGGGATDIEETWPNMARPIWQAAGQTWGAPTNVTFSSFASITRVPQYNHRLMTPAGKVNLPKYTNVTSNGRHPNGRLTAPGARGTRDSLRNRRG